MDSCPFCEHLEGLEPGSDVVEFPDAFPLSEGHTLVVPRAHEPDFFALGESVRSAAWARVAAVQYRIQAELSPDGFNVGLNVGLAGGQTVPHAHIHVIPRYEGDVADPRGGIRWVVPERAAYWPR